MDNSEVFEYCDTLNESAINILSAAENDVIQQYLIGQQHVGYCISCFHKFLVVSTVVNMTSYSINSYTICYWIITATFAADA